VIERVCAGVEPVIERGAGGEAVIERGAGGEAVLERGAGGEAVIERGAGGEREAVISIAVAAASASSDRSPTAPWVGRAARRAQTACAPRLRRWSDRSGGPHATSAVPLRARGRGRRRN